MENLWWIICEMMTLKYKPLKYSDTRILKTVIFYVVRTHLRGQLLNEAKYDNFYNVFLMSIYTFFLLFVHVLNSQFHSIYLKQKKICFPVFLPHFNSSLTSNWMHFYAPFKEHCWCSCVICVKIEDNLPLRDIGD